MAIYVNTDERLTYEDVATQLARAGNQYLANAVRALAEQAQQQAARYEALRSEYTRMVATLNTRRTDGEPVSYRPGPMSDG